MDRGDANAVAGPVSGRATGSFTCATGQPDLVFGQAQHREERTVKITKVSEADFKKRILDCGNGPLENLSEPRLIAPRGRSRKERGGREMMGRWMTGAGLDIDKLGQSLHEAREKEFGRLVEAHKRDTLWQAAKLRNKLPSGRRGQVKAFSTSRRSRTSSQAVRHSPQHTVPDLSNPPLELDPGGAIRYWAKFKYKTSEYRGTQKVSFYFYWANSLTTSRVVINATTFMSTSGHLKAHAPWTFGVNTSKVDVRTRFGVVVRRPARSKSCRIRRARICGDARPRQYNHGGDTNSASCS